MTLLQTSATDVLIPRLADQAFTVVLLIAAMIWILKQLNKQKDEQKAQQAEQKIEMKALQDKLEHYMNEDRKTMLDVIDRNTRVMAKVLEDRHDTKH